MITKSELLELIKKLRKATIDINEIVFKKDYYSRVDGMDQSAVIEYSKNTNTMDPILLNQNMIIINGVHRYHALLKAEQKQANVEIIDLPDEDIDLAGLILDLDYGVRHPEKDKKRMCIKKYSPKPEANKLLIKELSIPERTFYEWTDDIRREMKKEVNKSMAMTLLNPFKTQEQIAQDFGVSLSTVEKYKKLLTVKFAEIAKFTDEGAKQAYLEKLKIDNLDFLEDYLMFKPFIYGNWNFKDKESTNDHFGHFPKVFMDNILYRHTQPFDLVYDPFAGGGTTIDSCNFMFRRCICSDLNPVGHRQAEIFKHDIGNGFQKIIKIAGNEYKMPKPDLVFLDPPYWIQAEHQYSDSANDLSNMSLENYNSAMNKLFGEIYRKKVERIALIVQPTEYKNDFVWVDHFADFHQMVCQNYRIEKRYDLPYSSEQYNAQMVEKAKERNVALNLLRDLVVWRRK